MNQPAHSLTRPERLRLRVEDFETLADRDAFAHYAKAELIDGDIYVMNAQYHPHALAKSRLLVALANRLAAIGSDLEAVSEVAVRVNGDSMPEPDLVLTRWSGRGPVPVEAVALIIEVSDTTLETDLGRKAELYAAAGVPEYWVVDLAEQRVLMHEDPDADGYHGQLDVLFGAPLISSTIEGLDLGAVKLAD